MKGAFAAAASGPWGHADRWPCLTKRMCAGVPGACRRHLAVMRPCRTRTRRNHCSAQQAGNDRFGQRHGVDLDGHPQMARGKPCRMAPHRTRKTDAERLHRKLQWPPARRTAERNAVHHIGEARVALATRRADPQTNSESAKFDFSRLRTQMKKLQNLPPSALFGSQCPVQVRLYE